MRSSTPEESDPARSDGAEIGARRRLELTDPWLKVLEPDAVPVEYRDARQRGLVLRVEPSGRKTWVARYSFAGRDRRFRIGAYPETTLAKARKCAHGILAQADDGKDPQAERERLRAGETVTQSRRRPEHRGAPPTRECRFLGLWAEVLLLGRDPELRHSHLGIARLGCLFMTTR
jgi:hypothetical protein